MSRGLMFAKNLFVLGIGNFLPKFASFLVLPILTGCLTVEEYGTYDLLVTFVSLMLPLSTLQIQNAVFRYLIDSREDRNQIKSIISSAFIFEIPVSAIVLIIYMAVSASMDVGVRFWICAYYILDVVVVTLRQCVRGLGDNKTFSASAVFHALLEVALCYLLVFGFGLGLLGTSIMLAGATFAAAAYISLKFRIWDYLSIRSVKWYWIKKMLGYSWPLVPNQLSVWAMRMSNRLVITLFLGVTSNGIFAAAFKIPQAISFAQGTFQMAWQENATIYSGDSDSDEYYSKMFSMLFGCVVGLSSLLIAANPVLFTLLIRGNYAEAYCQIPLLVVAMLFSCLVSFYDGIYVARKNTVAIGFTALASAILNVALCFILIPLIGLTGASLAMLFSFAALFVFRLLHARRYVAIRYDARTIIGAFFVIFLQVTLSLKQEISLNIVNAFAGIVLFLLINRDLMHFISAKLKRKAENLRG